MAVKSEGSDFRARYDDYKMEFHRKCSTDPVNIRVHRARLWVTPERG